MNTKFKILFQINLLHEYYRDLLCTDLTIIPSPETQKLLKDGKMLLKVTDNKIIVLATVFASGTDENKPFIKLDNNKKFVFYLYLSNHGFLNFTNIDFSYQANRIFYFTNASQNKNLDTLYLSLPAADYKDNEAYKPGMLVRGIGVSGNVYECIKSIPDQNGIFYNTAYPNFWKSRGILQYPNSNDLVSGVNTITTLRVETASDYNVRAYSLNTSSNSKYDSEIFLQHKKPLSRSETGEPSLTDVKIDLTGVEPGRYRININDTDFNVYLDKTTAFSGCFGVIEILNHLPADDEFALLDEDGKIKDAVTEGEPTGVNYTIRFANRLAFLKYISTKRGVEAITDTSEVYSFASAPFPPPPLPVTPAEVFFSDAPIPMSESNDLFNIVLDAASGSDSLKAPGPNPQSSGVLTQFGDDYYCNVYLNY